MGEWHEITNEQGTENEKPVDEKGRTLRIDSADSNPPVSVRVASAQKQKTPSSPQIPIQFSADPVPKAMTSTPNLMAIETPKDQSSVDEQRKKTRSSLRKYVTIGGIVLNLAGGAAIIGYAFVPEKYDELYADFREKIKNALATKPSNDSESPNTASSSSALMDGQEKSSDEFRMSSIPGSKEKFLEMIKTGRIKINPETFTNAKAAEDGKYKPQQNNMKAVMMIEGQTSDGYDEWKIIDDKITDNKDGKNVVIAVRVIDPNDKKKLSFLNYKPLAEYTAKNDPGTHIYLFGGSEEENRQKRGASVMLKQTVNGRESLLGNADFVVPYGK